MTGFKERLSKRSGCRTKAIIYKRLNDDNNSTTYTDNTQKMYTNENIETVYPQKTESAEQVVNCIKQEYDKCKHT